MEEIQFAASRGSPADRHQVAEPRRERDDEHDERGIKRRLDENRPEVLEPQLPIYDESDEGRIENRDGGALGNRKDAAGHTDEDDQRHHQRPERGHRAARDLAPRHAFEDRVVAPDRDVVGHCHERKAEHDSGHDSAEE